MYNSLFHVEYRIPHNCQGLQHTLSDFLRHPPTPLQKENHKKTKKNNNIYQMEDLPKVYRINGFFFIDIIKCSLNIANYGWPFAIL